MKTTLKYIYRGLLMITLLTAAVEANGAYSVNYTISGASGDNWSGQFSLGDLGLTVDNMDNYLSVSANGLTPVNMAGGVGYVGSSSGGWLTWMGDGGDLTLGSLELYNAINAGGTWGGTWNDLIGHSYNIIPLDYQPNAVFTASDGGFTGHGGVIAFSASASSVPEPSQVVSLLALCGVGSLGALVKLRRRK